MPSPFYTAAMVRALPDDGRRYEAVYGELLVSPAPRVVHQRVVSNLAVALGTYLNPDPAIGVGEGPSELLRTRFPSWPGFSEVAEDHKREVDWPQPMFF